MKTTLLCLVLVVPSLGGCATKHFGHLAAIAPSERTGMSCQDVEAERIKIDRFDEQVRRKSKVNGASVLAFLGDFGLGNALSKQSATSSAAKRREQLRQIAQERGCPSDAAAASIAMR